MYIVKGTKIVKINRSEQSGGKIVYSTYDDAINKVARKHMSTVSNRIKKDILPQMVYVQRLVNYPRLKSKASRS